MQPPLHVQFVMSVLGGIGGASDDLLYMKRTADRLVKITLGLYFIGPYEFRLALLAITLGGHMRVGLEDNIYIDKDLMARSNAEFVARVVRLV